jgi:hypothetical protein
VHQFQLPATVSHGVFLRWPPCKAVGWWFPNRKNAPSSFSTRLRTRPLGVWLRRRSLTRSGRAAMRDDGKIVLGGAAKNGSRVVFALARLVQ